MVFAKFTPFQRSLISAIAGFIAYGAWAYLVNSMHGWQAGIKAACVQGSYSFMLTLIMTISMETLFALIAKKNSSTHQLFPAALTIVIVCGFMYTSSWLINVIAGTPEIFNTVILGYVLGTIYTIVYTYKLARSSVMKNSLS